MNKIKSTISYINKKLAKTKSGLAIFLVLGMNIGYIQNNNFGDELSDTLSQEKVISTIDKSKSVKSGNIDSIKKTKKLSDTAEYRFEDYMMLKLEYNDLENGTKNEAFEYLWFANGLNKNGNMKPSKILEHLQNTDKISDLVDRLCKKSFSDQIDWHQDAKRLDLVWGMLESGNDHDAESYAHCVGIRQFSLGAGKDYDIVKVGRNGKVVSDLRKNPMANISASHRYLKDNYNATGDLGLSYWGYHCGIGGLNVIKNIYTAKTGNKLCNIGDLYCSEDLPEAVARRIVSLRDNSFDYFAKINTAKYIYNQRKQNPKYIYDKIAIANGIKTFKQKGSMVEYERYPISDSTHQVANITNEMVKIDINNNHELDERLLYALGFLQGKSGSDIYSMTDFTKIENRSYYDSLGIHMNAILMKKGIKVPTNKIKNIDVFRFWLYQMRIWGWISRCEERLPSGQQMINISINPKANMVYSPKIAQKTQ